MGSSTGCIKSNKGTLIIEKEKILQEWNEYIGELFHDNRKPTIHKKHGRTCSIQSEARLALAMMNRNKAAGPDEILIEMISALNNFKINKVTKIINEMSDEILEDFSKSILIAMWKKPDVNEFKLYWTISLMSFMIKVIINILNRAHTWITPEREQKLWLWLRLRNKKSFIIRMISESNTNFRKTKNAIFIIRMI